MASGFTDRTTELGTPFDAFKLSSFGEDGAGNLYAVGINGDVFRIANALPEPGTWAMLMAGLLVVAMRARRRAPGETYNVALDTGQRPGFRIS